LPKSVIVCAQRIIDGVGDFAKLIQLEQKITEMGLPIHQLSIEPLAADWNSLEKNNCFRSGAAPIEALQKAKFLIDSGEQAVLISGKDFIKTGYDREERHRLMSALYEAENGKDFSIPQAYTDLAQRFIELHNVDKDTFKTLAAMLFENYLSSYANSLDAESVDCLDEDLLPSKKWYHFITELFRGVDCANPLIDFSGRLLVCSEQLADRLSIPNEHRVSVAGVATARLDQDGPDQIDIIANYDHLSSAYRDCCKTAGIDFAREFKKGNGLLEVYTCYPVVPLAFLMASGLVNSLQDVSSFLSKYLITVTGGMNLAKAPWNNPALNGLIAMHDGLINCDAQCGMVHGNGGLGYRQGVALLSK